MWPFNPKDLFGVNKDAIVTVVSKDPPILVVDDFYLEPEKVRNFVLAMPYPIWKHNANSKNFVDYYDCRHRLLLDYPEPQQRIAEIAHRHMRIRVLAPTRLFTTNLFRLINDQRPHTSAHPHADGIALAALVYLNHDEECSGGTAFYRHRFLQLTQLPRDPDEHERLSAQVFQGAEREDGSDYFHDWRETWEITQQVEMRFNRLLLWPGVAFHGAWHEHNSFKDAWRVNQVLFWDDIHYLDT